MKILTLFLLLISIGSQAATVAHCRLVNGIYINSEASLVDIKFETYADIFTIRNANTLTLNLEGEELRFIRSGISIDRHTSMNYVMRKNMVPVREMYVLLDRTPRDISLTRNFYGNMIISPEITSENPAITLIGKRSLNYNFYCWF